MGQGVKITKNKSTRGQDYIRQGEEYNRQRDNGQKYIRQEYIRQENNGQDYNGQ